MLMSCDKRNLLLTKPKITGNQDIPNRIFTRVPSDSTVANGITAYVTSTVSNTNIIIIQSDKKTLSDQQSHKMI